MASGVTREQISRYETNDQLPSLVTLPLLAKALKTRVEKLL